MDFLAEVKIEHIEVTDNIVLHRRSGTGLNEGNITCINTDEGLVFIDAGRIAEVAKIFRETMEKKFNKKAKFLIFTHIHNDHFFGIEAFKDLPIFASQQALDDYNKFEQEGKLSKEYRQGFIEAIKERAAKDEFTLSEEWHNDYAVNYLKANIFPITKGISNEKVFGLPEQRLLFKVIGGHSEDSAYLHYIPENVLITGDNFNCSHAENSPCMLANMKSKGIEILQMFEDLKPTKVIPGHGSVVDPSYIKKTREYFEAMFAKIKELKESGLSLEEVKNHPDLPEFFEDEKHSQWDRIMSSWYTQL